jgi:hypothetical protein
MVRIMSGVSEMKTVRSLIWVAVIVTVLGPGFLRLDGQEVIPADKSDTFRLTVAMEKQTLPKAPKSLANHQEPDRPFDPGPWGSLRVSCKDLGPRRTR